MHRSNQELLRTTFLAVKPIFIPKCIAVECDMSPADSRATNKGSSRLDYRNETAWLQWQSVGFFVLIISHFSKSTKAIHFHLIPLPQFRTSGHAHHPPCRRAAAWRAFWFKEWNKIHVFFGLQSCQKLISGYTKYFSNGSWDTMTRVCCCFAVTVVNVLIEAAHRTERQTQI